MKKEFQRCSDQWKTHWSVLNTKQTILKKINDSFIIISVLVYIALIWILLNIPYINNREDVVYNIQDNLSNLKK